MKKFNKFLVQLSIFTTILSVLIMFFQTDPLNTLQKIFLLFLAFESTMFNSIKIDALKENEND